MRVCFCERERERERGREREIERARLNKVHEIWTPTDAKQTQIRLVIILNYTNEWINAILNPVNIRVNIIPWN